MISTTGIAGLTLGGGLGWMMGRYGLSIDNLTSAEVVLADGTIVTASEDSEPDLFWALRGGGGNFGVATSFEFDSHPLETVLGGIVAHPLAAGAEVLDAYRTFTKDLSDDVTAFCGLVHAPDGSGVKLVAPILCHIGEPAQAEAELAPIRSVGSPALDTVDRIPYPAVNAMLDDGFPRGALNYWKSAFFTEMTDAALQIMIDALESAPSIMSGMVIEHIHGAATRVDATATAFPHREPGYNLLIAGEWLDPAESETNIAWVRDTFAALDSYTSPAGYVNYLGAEEADRVAAAYGPNHDRLRQIKGRYDPDNLFRLNQNIAPG